MGIIRVGLSAADSGLLPAPGGQFCCITELEKQDVTHLLTSAQDRCPHTLMQVTEIMLGCALRSECKFSCLG